VLVVLAVVVGASSGAAAVAGTVPSLDPGHLPKLPDQGLVVPESGGLLLMGLDGHVYGRLAGFLTYPDKAGSNGALFVHNVGIQALQTADPTLATVYDSHGRGWLLDTSARRLVPLDPIAVPIGNKTRLVIKVSGTDAGASTNALVTRGGKTLLSGDLTVIGTRYVATANFDSKKPGVLLDLATGKRWKLLPQCAVAGVSDGHAIAVCAPPGPNRSGRKPFGMYAFATDGKRRTLATFAPGLYTQAASLSPDGQWVLVYASPGCGPGWSAVYRVSGGTGHLVTGAGTIPTKGGLPTSRFSFGLGWTDDNRIVADIDAPKGSSCDKEVSSGTFTIDPDTLAQTHISSQRAAFMWNQ
jgi:hypothetical protein